MSSTPDGMMQPKTEPLAGSDDQFDESIIEYDSSPRTDDEDNDHIQYTEEIYLDIDNVENAEDSGGVIDEMKIEMIMDNDEEKDGSPDDLFHCSTCDINFHSVVQHIKQFHAEQEVLVDVDHADGKNAFEGVQLTDDPLVESSKVMAPLSTVNCPICGIPYAAPKGIAAHMRTHTSQVMRPEPVKKAKRPPRPKRAPDDDADAPTVCEICNTVFLTSKGLKLHARMHNPIRQRTLEEAAEHELLACPTKILEGEQTFFCDVCQKSFDMSFKEIHMMSHDGEEKFLCTSCNRKFSNEVHLNMHLMAHNEPREIPTKAAMRDIKLPYACQFCPKEFARPHEKVKHERVHTGEKPHSCEICGKTFRISYCLTLHMRTHTDARPYVCPHCNKRFKSQSVYNHHLMTHSDVRPYQCPYCPKAFKTPVQLSGHKNSHTKPFACTECSRPFATLYAVKAHMESHKRPNHNLKYACQICGATYARGFALKDHVKEQHSGSADTVTDENEMMDNETNLLDVKDEDEIDDEETKMAGRSILPDQPHNGGIEITIGGIDQFANEEVVTDWMK